MEKVFFVKNGDLEAVNKELASGGKIKAICPVAESVSNTKGATSSNTRSSLTGTIKVIGSVYAYVVIEYPENL